MDSPTADSRYKRLLALIGMLPPAIPNFASGTAAGQSNAVTSLTVVGTTVDAATVVVDTGYKPAAGHGAGIDGKWIATDRTNHRSRSGNVAGTIENYAGAVTIPGQLFGGSQGDASLAGSVPSFTISGGGTLVVTFTPVGGYVGHVEWIFNMNVTQN